MAGLADWQACVFFNHARSEFGRRIAALSQRIVHHKHAQRVFAGSSETSLCGNETIKATVATGKRSGELTKKAWAFYLNLQAAPETLPSKILMLGGDVLWDP